MVTDQTESYLEYKLWMRGTFAFILLFAMAFATCSYEYHVDAVDRADARAKAQEYRNSMFKQGFIEVPKPCKNNELMWVKPESK